MVQNTEMPGFWHFFVDTGGWLWYAEYVGAVEKAAFFA